MAINFNITSRINSREDSGFGANASGRFINKDGFANVEKKGIHFLDQFSWYHTMLNLPTISFISYLVLVYILVNLVFALIYYAIGIEHLTGIDKSNIINEFTDVFFFSSQTFTTVGYGRIAPIGFLASLVATFEAFMGLLAFAIATGLFYGRFSRPRAFLKFSKVALVSPYQDVTAIMFRLAPFKNNALVNGEVKISAAIETMENGEKKSKFFNLEPTLKTITSLSLNWTVVHKIDEHSPFFGFTEEDFKNTGIEIIVQIMAFDEVFSNTVIQNTSYITQEIVFGAKFLPMYYPTENRKSTILDINKIDHYERINLNSKP